MEQDLYKTFFESAKKTQEEIDEITDRCDELMQIDLYGETKPPDLSIEEPYICWAPPGRPA